MKKKLSLIIVVIGLMFLVVGCTKENDADTAKTEIPKQAEKYASELKMIDDCTSSTFKEKNYSAKITDENNDGKLEVAIALDTNDKRFNEAIWCAINGLGEIDGIKEYHPDFDKQIEAYNLKFFDGDAEKYSATVENKSNIDSIKLISKETGKATVVTRKEIKEYQDNEAKKEDTSTNKDNVDEGTNNTSTDSGNVPAEYKSALAKAYQYSDMAHMSKKGLYEQLTSEYGEKFSDEAAQYAVDNAKIDYNENALKKAEMYQEKMSMSPNAIYDQLISEYGEQFTKTQAKYAIDNLSK